MNIIPILYKRTDHILTILKVKYPIKNMALQRLIITCDIAFIILLVFFYSIFHLNNYNNRSIISYKKDIPFVKRYPHSFGIHQVKFHWCFVSPMKNSEQDFISLYTIYSLISSSHKTNIYNYFSGNNYNILLPKYKIKRLLKVFDSKHYLSNLQSFCLLYNCLLSTTI